MGSQYSLKYLQCMSPSGIAKMSLNDCSLFCKKHQASLSIQRNVQKDSKTFLDKIRTARNSDYTTKWTRLFYKNYGI
jgi:hypothetical protein